MERRAVFKPFFHGSDDEVAQSIKERYAPVIIKPADKSRRIEISGSFGNLGDVEYNATQYKFGVNVIPQDVDRAHFFVFPQSAACDFHAISSSLSASVGKGIYGDGEAMSKAVYPSGHSHIAISAKKRKCTGRIEALFGEMPQIPIKFDPIIDIEHSHLLQVTHLIHHLIHSGMGESYANAPFAARQMANLLVDSILEHWPSNYSKWFTSTPASIAPRHVKFATEYLKENLELMTSDEDLAQLCGVSLRSLQYGFRNFLGTSISQYERNLRLDRTNAELAAGALTVAEVSKRWGFSNPYRFSKLFESKFGFRPSQYRRA